MMNKGKLAQYAAVAALAIGFGNAAAQDATVETYLDFDRVDTDGNGCVDWEELRNASLLFWHALDLNRDNILAGDEHPEAVDGDGEPVRPASVDTTRFQAAMYVAFDTADKDQDDCLSRREYESD